MKSCSVLNNQLDSNAFLLSLGKTSLSKSADESLFIHNTKQRKKVIEFLHEQWVCQQVAKEQFVFYKHVKARYKHKLYQIVMSGQGYDGLYDLNFKGFEIGMKNSCDEFGNSTLEINSKGNYGIAEFEGEHPKGYIIRDGLASYGYSVIREDYETEEDFKSALLSVGVITEEEYEMYRFAHDHKCAEYFSKHMLSVTIR